MFLKTPQTKNIFQLLLCFVIQLGAQIRPREESLVYLKYYLDRTLKLSIIIMLSIDKNDRLG